MTIDEAIADAKRKAKNHREMLKTFTNSADKMVCRNNAEEHEQLARWLEELKELRVLFKCEAFRDGIDALRDMICEHEKSTGQMPDVDIINDIAERLKGGEWKGH